MAAKMTWLGGVNYVRDDALECLHLSDPGRAIGLVRDTDRCSRGQHSTAQDGHFAMVVIKARPLYSYAAL